MKIVEMARQWELMKDSDRNLLGGFPRRWEERSTLPGPFIEEARGLVSDAFDAVIELDCVREAITMGISVNIPDRMIEYIKEPYDHPPGTNGK